jgi:hypothetical protein
MPRYAGPVQFPDFGPDDTREEREALIEDFKESWYIWHTTSWHSNPKDVFYWPPYADSAADMREKLDRMMANAIPKLRAQLREAEAAAERLQAARKLSVSE